MPGIDLEPAADRPVGEGAQVARVGRAGRIAQADQHDVAHQRGDRSHVGSDAVGQGLGGAGEPLLDELARLVDVGAPVELDEDQREARCRWSSAGG